MQKIVELAQLGKQVFTKNEENGTQRLKFPQI